MYSRGGIPSLGAEISGLASTSKQMLKSLWVDQSEAPFFDGSTLSSETENREALISGDDSRRITTMKQLLATLLSQRRLDRLLPEVVKVMSTSNVELKRLCYLYVGLACQKVLRHPSDWAVQERAVLLLTINAFQKDSAHRNHIIRAWALRAMSSLPLPEVLQSLTTAIYRCAADGSPYVRQIAAQAVPKVIALDSTLLGNILDGVLLRLIADVEISVTSLAYQSLYEILLMLPILTSVKVEDILKFETSFGINIAEQPIPFLSILHPHFCKVVANLLPRMTPHGQVTAIHVLTLYCRTFFTSPTTSRHFENLINQLSEILRFASCASVATACITSLFSLLPNDEALLAKICPHIFHWLRLLGHSPTSNGGHAFFEIIQMIASSHPHLIVSEVPLVLLNFKDSTFLKRTKIKLLETLAEHPAFPFDIVFDDLVAAAHWDFPSQNGFSVSETLDCLTSISLKRMKVAAGDSESSLDRCTKELMNLMTYCSSIPLVDNAIRCLHNVSFSQLSNSRHLQSICLHVAQRLATDCAMSIADGKLDNRVRGRAAMIGLLSLHHRDVPQIAIDVFRVLVEATSIDHPALSSSVIQLEIINLGVSLWSLFRLAVEGTDTTETLTKSKEIYPRLNHLVYFLLSHFKIAATDRCVQEIAWLFHQLIIQSNETESPTNQIKNFGAVLASTLRETGVRRDGRQTSIHKDDEIFTPGTISSATRYRFRGFITFPDFIKTGSDRTEAPDTIRLPLPPTSARRTVKDRGKAELSSGPNEDDELDAFYRATENDVRLAIGSKQENPLVRLFGTKSITRKNEEQRGVIIFGEGDSDSERSNEADEMQGLNMSNIWAKEAKRKENDESSEDSDDWDAIEKCTTQP